MSCMHASLKEAEASASLGREFGGVKYPLYNIFHGRLFMWLEGAHLVSAKTTRRRSCQCML